MNVRQVFDARALGVERVDLVWSIALPEPEIAHDEQDNDNDADDRKDVTHLVPPMPVGTWITRFDSRRTPNRHNEADTRSLKSFITSAL
jgi:hypothetical protein